MLLLSRGASSAIADIYGNTPLHCAVVSGNYPELIEALLAGGADPNLKNELGKSPLDHATQLGRTALIELLEKHQARE
jgi:ankyrin repeat protein